VRKTLGQRAWWRQAGIDPIKVARRLWKATLGPGHRPSLRAALPQLPGAAPSDQYNDEMGTTATVQEQTRLSDLPGQQGWMLEHRDASMWRLFAALPFDAG
jgi:hypothetical protein